MAECITDFFYHIFTSSVIYYWTDALQPEYICFTRIRMTAKEPIKMGE